MSEPQRSGVPVLASTPAMAAPIFRPARETDLDRLVEIHAASFPDARGEVARRRNFAHNPLGPLACLHVGELDGEIVAHAFLFSFASWFGGREVKIGGVASVGVAPEARGRGIATALFAHLHDVARARGDAATLLYAFRQGFYTRLGYAPVSSMRRLVVAPTAVPEVWSRGAVSVRAARGEDRASIEALHTAVGARVTGWLARGEEAWDARFSHERRSWFLAERAGEPVGYLAWRPRQTEAHALVDLDVDDLVATDDETRRALFGLLGRQRDQVRAFCIFVAADDPIEHALTDADAFRHGDASVEHCLGEIVGGPLLRLTDLVQAVEARGYAVAGHLALRILPDQGASGEPSALDLRVDDSGRATARLGGSTPDAAEVEVTRATFGAILLGSLAPEAAARLALLRARSDDALRRVGAMLTLSPFFNVDPF